MSDNINHPPHYNNSSAQCECGRRIECIDVTRHMSFNIGNAIKYLWRYQLKNGIEDLKKARWYLDDAIKQMETKYALTNPTKGNNMTKWVSVKKGLPDNCHTIIATDETGLVVPAFYHLKKEIWMFWTGYKYMDLKIFEPTYWMPLPTPPEV